MKKIKVNLGRRSYYIYIGYNIIKDISNLIPSDVLKNPILIITNKKINSLIGKTLLKALNVSPNMIHPVRNYVSAGSKFDISNGVHIKEVPDSERAKSFKIYNQIISTLSKIGRKRKPTIIALGGGVVGDIAGFAASTYRRGIPYIQIPTTLLAEVDSSIGGKVAIDLPQAKNIVGSFYQPKAVICDIALLHTLPKKEIKNGLAEVIKYGIIRDRRFFEYLERNLKNILNLKKPCVEYVVWKCACIKAGVVEKDEFDTKGIRAILNFGHTFGHAIEASFKYSKKFTHGEAVATGMILAGNTALKLAMIKSKEVNRITKIIRRSGLPVNLKGANTKKIIETIDYDKKFLHGTNRFVLPRRIGVVEIVEGVPELLIRTVLNNNVVA